ncbi:three-Cys-motif partner protein TcmP [Microbacterium sp. LWO14-1.2]|uniref:three-Cys-motif partner protein TcmP n=1 Tax=Microbacterium sp. LWO14-1.2 TaxID=3135263 RepID=UPI00313A1A2F
MPKETIWDLAPHTGAKHEILTGYLKAWFPVLARYRGRIVLLDAFAGPGSYSNGEPGSPLLAIRTLLGHSYLDEMIANCEILMIFNEHDKKRFKALESAIENEQSTYANWPENLRVHAVNENFVNLAEDILEQLDGAQLAPTFAFLDPFGYRDVPMDLIARLLAYKRCELFIYFDYNSVSRFATAGNVDDALTALYGTDEFKDAPPAGDPDRPGFLLALYERQLREVCGFEHVQSFAMLNNQNKINNYMIFCTRSLKGLNTMKTAMWKVDPMGEYRFADRLANKPVLFGLTDPDMSPLRDALLDVFGGQSVRIEDIEEFVIAETPYLQSHIKRRTLVPMIDEGWARSSNMRRGQFPPGTIVTFAG